MTAPFFLGIALLCMAPAAGREKSFNANDLSEDQAIRLKDDKYDALVIEDIYADQMYISANEKPGGGGSGFNATIIKNHSISRNTFRIDLTSLEKGTYYIHTGACYAMYQYKLVLK